MRLWTILEEDGWRRLETDGVFRTDGARTEPYFRPAYRWMTAQMTRRLGPAPGGVEWPAWAWARAPGRLRPDLRERGHLPRGTKGFRLELEIAPERALLSDFDAWHLVLNGGYYAPSEAAAADFDRRLAAIPRAQRSAVARAETEQSWERIFDLDSGDPDWCGRSVDNGVQACLWEIVKADVRRVDAFTAR